MLSKYGFIYLEMNRKLNGMLAVGGWLLAVGL